MVAISQNKNTTNLSFPTSLVSDNYVDKFVKYLRFAELSSNNKLSKKQANDIAKELKKEWWASNATNFLKGINK